MSGKLTPCFWLNNRAEEAAHYYAGVFSSPAPSISRLPDGSVLTAHVDIAGTTFMLLNGNPNQSFNQSTSFMVDCKTQAEVDHFWDTFIGDGGKPSMCGWLEDKYGVSWQIVPDAITRTVGGPDPAGRARAFQKMMTMRKLIIADLEAAYAGTA